MLQEIYQRPHLRDNAVPSIFNESRNNLIVAVDKFNFGEHNYFNFHTVVEDSLVIGN